jgi:deoxyguanosine kinase
MFFLCNRYKQLSDIKTEITIGQKSVVADYNIFKNLIFAQRTLDSAEYKKYEEIYSILTKDMPIPNIIVYLHASIDTLMERISLRGRDFEKNMDRAYLQQLSDDYDTFITHFESTHPNIPVLRFNGDDLDFVNNKKDLQFILDTVDSTIRKGVSFN